MRCLLLPLLKGKAAEGCAIWHPQPTDKYVLVSQLVGQSLIQSCSPPSSVSKQPSLPTYPPTYLDGVYYGLSQTESNQLTVPILM